MLDDTNKMGRARRCLGPPSSAGLSGSCRPRPVARQLYEGGVHTPQANQGAVFRRISATRATTPTPEYREAAD